jgi:acyl-coenzyme A thioesterase PaaI-like protein
MKKIINPFIHWEGYNCFGCSPANEHGLRMEFREEGDYVLCTWNPLPHFQGWQDVLHGGIQATLMDEIASWVVFVKVRTSGVTSRMDVRLSKAVYVSDGPVHLRAKLQEMKRNIAMVHVELFDHNENLCSEGVIHYYTYPEERAREKLRYPGYDKFYE